MTLFFFLGGGGMRSGGGGGGGGGVECIFGTGHNKNPDITPSSLSRSKTNKRSMSDACALGPNCIWGTSRDCVFSARLCTFDVTNILGANCPG